MEGSSQAHEVRSLRLKTRSTTSTAGSRISGGSGRSRCLQWPRRPGARRGRGRRRLRVLVKDVLFDLLQFGDLARHLLLAGREPLDAVHYLLLTGGDTGSDPVDAAGYLLLTGGNTGGDPVDALPHRVEVA